MNQYKITMTCDRNQLIRFIDIVGLDNATVEVLPQDNSTPQPEPAPRRGGALRGKRGSKVNNTILDELRHGERSSKDLRRALEASGFAPGSLSTGLAILQREDRIERVGDGVYALKMAKAAE